MDETLIEVEENPPYLTVMAGAGCYLVALMEANRKGEYRIAKQSPSLTKKHDAENWAKAWSEREGIEIR